MNWEKIGPILRFTVENKAINLRKIRLVLFETLWMRYSVSSNIKNLSMNLQKYVFIEKNEILNYLTIWLITQVGNMSNENTSTASLYSKQWFHEEQETKFM